MEWKDLTIRAWRADFRWVAFNVKHLSIQNAKCFKSAIDADQYCMSLNDHSNNWQFDHLGNIKAYINPVQKKQIDWNALFGKLNEFNIKAIKNDQPLLSQLANGLYCIAAIRKPYSPFLSFKKFKVVISHYDSSNERLYDDYLEALMDVDKFSHNNSETIKFYGIVENISKEFAEPLFSISNNQDSISITSAFDTFCDPTLMILRESPVFIRYKKERNQLLFYDEFSKNCTWFKLPTGFSLENFYALQTNISKFKSHE